MQPERHQWLVIGCGSIGRRHIENLLELGEEDIFAFDLDPTRRDAIRAELGVRVCGSLDECWEAGPSVAIIATPTSSHVSLALEAASRGASLFIEKPLSNTLNGCDELISLVAEMDLVTLVGCNLRFHPGIARLKWLVDDGAIGKVLAARLEFGQYLPDWHPAEDYRRSYSAREDLGGGVILDAIHEIDYIRWIVGEIDEVACLADRLSGLEIETEDVAAIIARFSSGAVGEIHLDYVQRAYSRSCQLMGETGTLRWRWDVPRVHLDGPAGEEQAFDLPSGWEPNQMYLDEMAHLTGCLEGTERPMLDIREATDVLRIALAAKESALTRQFIRLK